MRLAVHPVTPQDRLIHKAAELLRQGGLALCPTDAGYALVWSTYESTWQNNLPDFSRVKGGFQPAR